MRIYSGDESAFLGRTYHVDSKMIEKCEFTPGFLAGLFWEDTDPEVWNPSFKIPISITGPFKIVQIFYIQNEF